MAVTTHVERVVGNPGIRAFSKAFSSARRPGGAKKHNPGAEIIGFTLANPGNIRKEHSTSMAKKKKASHAGKHHPGGYAMTKYNKGAMHKAHKKHHHNPGMLSNLGPMVTNALFVIVGALGSKLGAQAVLGSNNTGPMGYAANAGVGAVMWFLAAKVMKNANAAAGVVAGTLVQILLRIINDYTPFGSYVAQLGMGDYQMQSFVTPQVLVDPWRNADIQIPAGWGPAAATMAGAPMAALPSVMAAGSPAGTTASKGLTGLYGGRGPKLYGAAA